MLRMFDFQCADDHVTERLINDGVRSITCPTCGKDAHRLVSSPQFKLEAFTGAYPTAYDKWERVRAEKLKQERKQNSE